MKKILKKKRLFSEYQYKIIILIKMNLFDILFRKKMSVVRIRRSGGKIVQDCDCYMFEKNKIYKTLY